MQEEDKTGCFGKWIRVFKIIRTDKRGLWYWEVSYDFPVCNPVLDRRKMDRKVLFFDIDGTLLSESTREVPKSARDALERAQARGHLTFINTGRTISGLPPMFLEMPFSGYLCGCGTYIKYKDEVLMARSIPHQRGREIIQLVGDCDGGLVLEGQEDCYLPGSRSRFEQVENFRRHFRNAGLGIRHAIEEDAFDFDKFVIFVDERTDQKRLFRELGKDMEIIDRLGGLYEIVPKGYSKATAISYILNYFQMKLEDAYVFGDSSNDLAMFQYVKHAVAMGHHDPVLEPYAEFITRTVEEDGLAFAMKHYGLS